MPPLEVEFEAAAAAEEEEAFLEEKEAFRACFS